MALKTKKRKSKEVSEPQTPHEWKVQQLTQAQVEYHAAVGLSEGPEEVKEALKTLFGKYAPLAQEFNGARAVLGYKNVAKVTIMGQDPAVVAKFAG
jgi:hypothetical protein